MRRQAATLSRLSVFARWWIPESVTIVPVLKALRWISPTLSRAGHIFVSSVVIGRTFGLDTVQMRQGILGRFNHRVGRANGNRQPWIGLSGEGDTLQAEKVAAWQAHNARPDVLNKFEISNESVIALANAVHRRIEAQPIRTLDTFQHLERPRNLARIGKRSLVRVLFCSKKFCPAGEGSSRGSLRSYIRKLEGSSRGSLRSYTRATFVYATARRRTPGSPSFVCNILYI